MARRDFFAKKFSEYRQNFLPFDYYDFWLTAKENENLRFKNKLRDYLHTPFDWDENLEIYKEAEIDRIVRANQATQTTDRPNRHDHLKKITNSNKARATNEQQPPNHGQVVVVSNNHNHNNHSSNNNNVTFVRKQPSKKATTTTSSSVVSNKSAIIKKPTTKSAYVQVNFESKKKVPATTTASQIAKNKRRSKSAKNSAAVTNSFKYESANVATSNGQLLNNYKLARSMSNMAIQTPIEWNLRDYSKRSVLTKSAQSLPRSSSSMANFQPRRPPFANYGWAAKTQDLCLKPTRNSLANKVLARKFHDENALTELKLQKLKKEANQVANEQCAMESKSLDRFHSDSRDWTSEYALKYPDYSKKVQKEDYYFSSNPNKLNKSTLHGDFQPLKRGPKSANAKFYYYE